MWVRLPFQPDVCPCFPESCLMVGMTTAGDRTSQTEQGGTASLAPLPFCRAETYHAETMTHKDESLESVVANSSTDSELQLCLWSRSLRFNFCGQHELCCFSCTHEREYLNIRSQSRAKARV